MFQPVIERSEHKNWDDAVLEWEIYDTEEDPELESTCICGKENIRYLYTIRNINNNNLLAPVGSQCIKKFNRVEFNEHVDVSEKLFALLHAIENREYIELNSKYFSRKLLYFLSEENAFKDSQYNTAEQGYQFMLDMFNKRNLPSEKQQRKINAIIMSDIRPYLQERLEGKIRTTNL